MLPSVCFHKFRFGVLGLALVFLLGLGAFPGSSNGRPGTHPESVLKPMAKPAQAPPSAPPVTADSVLPYLFYGATPLTTSTPAGPCASTTTCPTPVLVFVHGLSGTYADWLESANCPPAPTFCGSVKGVPTAGVGSGNNMYDYAYAAGFRTAFMSLSLNNTSNTSNIQ